MIEKAQLLDISELDGQLIEMTEASDEDRGIVVLMGGRVFHVPADPHETIEEQVTN